MMNRNQKALLELLKASLFGIEPELPEGIDWDAVLREAQAQTVVALAAKAVPRKAAAAWQESAMQSQANFIRVLHGQAQLVQLFEQAGIPLVIIKGMAAAKNYPEPYRRMMGDIDFLVPQDQFRQSVELMAANMYITKDDCQKIIEQGPTPRHIEFFKNGIEFELHHHFSYFDIDIENSLIDGLNHAIEARVGDYSFPALPPLEHGMLLLAHIRHHLNNSELGLRQVIDWMMFVYKELDEETWRKRFGKMAEEAGLKELAVFLTRLCRDFIGLPGEYSWCNEADQQTAAPLLELVFDRGNFGRKVDNHYNLQNIVAKVRSRGFILFLSQTARSIWTGQSVQQRNIITRPFVFLKEFGILFSSRMKASRGKIVSDLKDGDQLARLYKELGFKE